MSDTDKFSVKEAVAGLLFLAIVGGAMYYTLSLFNSEGTNKEVEISNLGSGEAENIEAAVKILAIDPIKGDITARIEFDPSGTLQNADGTLKQELRVNINSANGKQETDFAKGRRLTPIEGVFNMYNGNATEYPFDKYSADIELYIVKTKPAPKKTPEPTPKPADDEDVDGEKPAAPKKAEADDADEDSNEIPLSVVFEGSIPGYTITPARADFSDESYVVVHANVERASTVKFFSIFVSALMWILSIGVILLTASVLMRGRKAELGMFSFMASLLFAFYAVRNSQPNVPPIGVFSDFIAFFWVEVIVATCLIASLLVWLFRASK